MAPGRRGTGKLIAQWELGRGTPIAGARSPHESGQGKKGQS